MSASTAANESWKEAPRTLSGLSTRTTSAAQASSRSENGLRSTITARRATAVIRKERWVGTLAPESTR